MKVLIVGDPHGKLGKIKNLNLKKLDLILITGDLGKADLARKIAFENAKRRRKQLPEIEEDADFSKKVWKGIYNSSMRILKYLHKFAPTYTIMGNIWNTDKSVKKDEKKFGIKLPHLVKDIRKLKNVHLVKNSIRNINGLKIGFLEYFMDVSWFKEFNEKGKKRINQARKETTKAKKVLKWFGKSKIDILVCHQPPYGYLDKVSSKYNPPKDWIGKHAGSKVILDYVKKKHPRYVFCGHIHEAKGKKKIGKTEVYNVGFSGDYLVLGI